MFDIFPLISQYMPYIIPPLVGAFIGYLTNKIAIRMLFRPLKPLYLFGLRIPMTPGVIPAKRGLLAVNIGKMVGRHLLTSKEITNALKKKSFQEHLLKLIQTRFSRIFTKDLAPLPELIPRRYSSYFDIGTKTLRYQITKQVFAYTQTKEFEDRIHAAVHEGVTTFLEKDIDTVIDGDKRQVIYASLEQYIGKILASTTMKQWLEDFLFAQSYTIIVRKKCVTDILPDSLISLIISTVESKVPDLLEKIADLLQDPGIQDKIVEGVKKGVASFSQTLGPMGAMVQNFLNTETIEKGVKEYLKNNEQEIAAMLNNTEVRQKIADLIIERMHHYMNVPLASLLNKNDNLDTRKICRSISEYISTLLQEEGVAKTVSSMLKDNVEIYIAGGTRKIQGIIAETAGPQGIENCCNVMAKAVVGFVRTEKTKKLIDHVVNRLFSHLLQKPVGKLSNFLPSGVRDGMYASIQKISSAMLATEVPGLVASLNIEQIVTEKVDSLDLLKLERLLLSIMEEQFKYINLFGALLGFLIGLLNVLVLHVF